MSRTTGVSVTSSVRGHFRGAASGGPWAWGLHCPWSGLGRRPRSALASVGLLPVGPSAGWEAGGLQACSLARSQLAQVCHWHRGLGTASAEVSPCGRGAGTVRGTSPQRPAGTCSPPQSVCTTGLGEGRPEAWSRPGARALTAVCPSLRSTSTASARSRAPPPGSRPAPRAASRSPRPEGPAATCLLRGEDASAQAPECPPRPPLLCPSLPHRLAGRRLGH